MKKKKTSIAALALSILFLVQAMPPVTVSAAGMTNDQYVYTFLTQRLGLPHASASGLMANIDQESAFLPTASCTDINGKTSYGLMQWNGPRFEQLKAFCSENGYGYDTLEGQLAFLENDLTGAYVGYYDYLLYGIEDSEQGAYDAAYFWAVQYEVCSTIYFEVRAELAEYYYYPAYLEEAPAQPVSMETDFYAALRTESTGMALTDDGKSNQMTTYISGDSSQVWHFVKVSGQDTYEITNCKTGRALDADSSDTAQWGIYETVYGYQLKVSDSDDALGYDEDGNVWRQVSGGSQWQSFQLERVQKAATPAKLRVTYEAAPSVVSMRWETAANADSYCLKIYSGNTVKNTALLAEKELTTLQYETSLPAGSYTAVLASVNACGTFATTPVSFTIAQQEPVDLGSQFYAKISWDDGAQYLTGTVDMQVQSQDVDYQEDQLWEFVRKDAEDSYQIYTSTGDALCVQEDGSAAVQETTADAVTAWRIYGDAESGYLLQPVGADTVLSVQEDAQLATGLYLAADGQQFAIADYVLEAPEVCVDASGGARESTAFTWEPADCTKGYVLTIRAEDGTVVRSQQLSATESGTQVQLPAGNYQATLSVTSTVTGETAVSESAAFVVADLPERPVASIALGSESGTVTLGWNRCTGASTYGYRICDAETGETVRCKAGGKGFQDTVTLECGQYLLTVIAKNQEGSISSEPVLLEVTERAEASMRSILAAKKQALALDIT
jgi:hypothetical protein